jgi:hypothetical protein
LQDQSFAWWRSFAAGGGFRQFFVVLLIHQWMDEDIISPTVSFYVPGT